ncbi:MAG: hypothetical protein E2O29_01825 [Deltaproteobacteria bacterium]|nr:MAG: hypothetical protein E2O29_01825 [Deltaproteobacteria bacterium]
MDFKFKMGDTVVIDEIERPGRIVSIWIQHIGMQYEVRYFLDGEAKSVFMFDNELTLKVRS